MVILINAAIAAFLIALLISFILGTWGKVLLVAGGVIVGLVIAFYVVVFAIDPKGFAAAMRRADEQQKLKASLRDAAAARAKNEWNSRPR